MKFIATSDFRNVKALGLKIDGAIHEDHVHKGATFEIGQGDNIEEMALADQQNIALLFHSGRIISEENSKGAALVKKELAEESKKASKLEKAAPATK